jgi:hypothetical protein
MIKNGIYALSALATDGAGVDAGGVLILHDGKFTAAILTFITSGPTNVPVEIGKVKC